MLIEKAAAAIGRRNARHGLRRACSARASTSCGIRWRGATLKRIAKIRIWRDASASAWVKGLQSQGVAASLKHFACNNQEFERFRGNSVVDERTLREIYLPQFETVVKEAKPWTVMCSYNRINGTYASQNNYFAE